MFGILAFGWRAVAAARAGLYGGGWLQRHTLDQPVVSVGALSVGGAGKTPTAAAIAALLLEAGHRPAILSRGYKRSGTEPLLVSRGDGDGPRVDAREAGDEPFWLASVLPHVPVAVAARREQAAAQVPAAAPVDVFVLDDGFQHVRVAREVDLVVVRPDSPFWEDRPLPAGRLRESAAAAARATGFVVVDHGGNAADTAAQLERRFPGTPCFVLQPRPATAWPIAEPLPPAAGAAAATLPGAAGRLEGGAHAFAGIAAPRRFYADLEAAGIELTGTSSFADHHAYSAAELQELGRSAAAAGAGCLITTEKDAVRLPAERPALPIWAWTYRLTAADPEALLSWLRAETGLEPRS